MYVRWVWNSMVCSAVSLLSTAACTVQYKDNQVFSRVLLSEQLYRQKNPNSNELIFTLLDSVLDVIQF